jgi:hypothetical protein
VQHQSAAASPTAIDPRPTRTTCPPAQTTVIDLVADSSHRGGQGFKSPQLHRVLAVQGAVRFSGSCVGAVVGASREFGFWSFLVMLVPTGLAVITFTTSADMRGRLMGLYLLVFLGGAPLARRWSAGSPNSSGRG